VCLYLYPELANVIICNKKSSLMKVGKLNMREHQRVNSVWHSDFTEKNVCIETGWYVYQLSKFHWLHLPNCEHCCELSELIKHNLVGDILLTVVSTLHKTLYKLGRHFLFSTHAHDWLQKRSHSFFHRHTSSMNLSRPRSWRVLCVSRHSFFSTTTWVAIPAWSQPGFHSTVRPHILCLRQMSDNWA